jgi:hypothetical protein
VSLVRQIDGELARLVELQQDSAAPPTTLGFAAADLDAAGNLLCESTLEEDGFQRAHVLIVGARGRLDGVGQEDRELAGILAARVQELRDLYGKTDKLPKSETLKDRDKTRRMEAELPDLFAAVNRSEYADASKIDRSQYYWLDHTVERLFILRYFIERFEKTEKAEDDEGKRWHEEIKALEPHLLHLLRQRTWASLEEARRLKQQIFAGVFKKDVQDQLERGRDAVEISTEPHCPAVNEPVTLRAFFRNSHYEICMARREFDCVWDFDELGTERGWSISHYFAEPRSYELKVTFEDREGRVVDRQPVTRRVEVKSDRPRWGDRTRVEVIRFVVAMSVTLLGLLAGAREQIAKLDFVAGMVAVFLIGFGADTVKNLLTRRPDEQPGNKE